jgi:hypothetical protein
LAEKNEHLTALREARQMAVQARRSLVLQLARGNKGALSSDDRKLLLETQAAIEAIDNAIEDERRIEGEENPAASVTGNLQRS